MRGSALMPTAYPAAHAVASSMEEYFHRYAASQEPSADTAALLPDRAAIERIIDTAFWASLRREEGYVPKISLAFLRPEHTRYPLMFARPLPLTAQALSKLAPAVERPGIHLGVWRERDELTVWGTTRDIPTFSFVLEVIDPGLPVVKHRRGDAGKFVNLVVLEGDRVKVVDEKASILPECPPLLQSLLGFHAAASPDEPVNVFV